MTETSVKQIKPAGSGFKEKHVQTLFGKKNKLEGFFELKLCKGKSIRWDAVKPHQIEALKKAKDEGIYHKISDSLPIFGGNKHMRFTAKKPFDCLFLKAPAYVVVCFYIPRKQKTCYYIKIDRYLEAWGKSDKKSYTEEDAELIFWDKIDL